MLQGFTATLCVIGSGLIVWMRGLNQLNRINTTSLQYVACNALGFLLLLVAMIIDIKTEILGGWLYHGVVFIVTTWITMLIFRKRK